MVFLSGAQSARRKRAPSCFTVAMWTHGWLHASRPALRTRKLRLANTDLARSTLKERIRKAQELRTTHSVLREQIQESIRLLTERCDLLTSQTVREPWFPASSVAPKLLPDSLPSSRGLEPQRSSEASAR